MDEQDLVASKRGATRLRFTWLLRVYTERGRFPRGRGELTDAAVDYVARQVSVQAAELAFYGWSGRTIEFHRSQIRGVLGFREYSVSDADKLADWLIANGHPRGTRRRSGAPDQRPRRVRVTKELIREFKRVTGKENLLFRVGGATVNAGDQLVGDTVFPVASQAVVADLVAGFKSSGPTYQRTVKGSWTNHYRTGLIKLLDVLEFRSNDTTHRPVLDALRLITRHASVGNLHYYLAGEDILVHRGLGGDRHTLTARNAVPS